jgi:hypothetical protein
MVAEVTLSFPRVFGTASILAAIALTIAIGLAQPAD